MSVTYQPSINYEQKAASASYYSYTKVLQNNGGANVNLTATAATTSQFDLPAQVFNLSKSFLRFDIYLQQNGAVPNGMLTKIPPIRRMTLMTRSGRTIVDIPNFQHFWQVTKNLIVKESEFENYPPPGVGNILDGSVANGAANTYFIAANNGILLYNNPSHSLSTTPPAVVSTTHGATIRNGVPGVEAMVDNLSARRKNYVTESQFVTGSAFANANNSIFAKCELRFGKIPFSFFQVDRDFFTTEALQLQVEWEGWNTWAFTRPAAADLVACVPTTATVGLINLELYMAIEMNEGIRQSVMAKVMSGGLAQVIPYTTFYQQQLGTNPAASVNLKINRGHGERLLRVISAENVLDLYGDQLAGRCLFANLDPAEGLTQVYNTQLDSRRLQIQDLDVFKQDDYRFNYEKIKKTILRNVQEYYTNCPVHIDDWSACDDLTESGEKDLQECGLDLSAEKMWTKYISTKSIHNSQMNVVIVCQKTLVSGPQGIMI